MNVFVYLICLVLAALRVSGEKGEIFQALAHLWVGILVGVWWLAKFRCPVCEEREGRIAGWLVVVLSVEVLCFFARRGCPRGRSVVRWSRGPLPRIPTMAHAFTTDN